MDFLVEESKLNFIPTLAFKNGGKTVYIHSKYDPIREAKQWAEENFEPKKHFYVVFGGGLLYHARELLKLMNQDEPYKVMVVEPNIDVVRFLFENKLIRDLIEDERFLLISYENIDDFSLNIIREFEKMNPEEIKFVFFSRYPDFYIEDYKKIIFFIKKSLLLSDVEMNTLTEFSVNHVANILSNVYPMRQSTFVMPFRGVFSGKAAVIVSAGPSLEKNIRQLKGKEDELLIISGGRTLKSLLKEGIRPHFVVSLDPTYENYELLLNELDCEVPILLSMLSNYNIADNYSGPKVFVDNSMVPGLSDRFFGTHVDSISVNGTVAIMQMNFADYLGCKNIALIGQDLAFTDKKNHAATAANRGENNSPKYAGKQVIVKGNCVEQIETDELFLSYIHMFEDQLEESAHLNVINCTEGGAYIKGTKVSTLSEFLEMYSEPKESIREKISSILEENRNEYPLSMILEKLKEMERDSYQVIKLTKEGLSLVQKLLQKDIVYEKEINRLEKIERQVEKKMDNSPIPTLLSRDIVKQIQDAQRGVKKSEEIDKVKTHLRMIRAVFATIQGSYKFFNEILRSTIKRKKDQSCEKNVGGENNDE